MILLRNLGLHGRFKGMTVLARARRVYVPEEPSPKRKLRRPAKDPKRFVSVSALGDFLGQSHGATIAILRQVGVKLEKVHPDFGKRWEPVSQKDAKKAIAYVRAKQGALAVRLAELASERETRAMSTGRARS